MKLKLSTPPESVISTLGEEWQSAYDAYREHHGGVEQYEKWQEKQLEILNRKKESYIGSKFLWESPSGNKWCAFEDCQWIENLYPRTESRLFCYYETIPYAGIFLKIKSLSPVTNEEVDGAIIYESHFFERCVERGFYEWNGVDTLIEFIRNNYKASVYSADTAEHRVDIRFDKCIGRGFFDPKYEERFLRIKTILSDEQLTNRQRKETMDGRRWGDASKRFIGDDAQARNSAALVKAMMDDRLDEFEDEYKRDFARSAMMSTEEVDNLFKTFEFVIALLCKVRPSLTSRLYNPFEDEEKKKQVSGDVAEMLLQYYKDGDEDFFIRRTYDIVIDLSIYYGKKVTRQSLIKAMYNLRKKRK